MNKNRSLLIIGFEGVLRKLVKKTADLFQPFAPYILKSLFPVMAISIAVMRESAENLGREIVIHSKDEDFGVLYAVIDGLTFKHKPTRCVCAKYLTICIRKFPVIEVLFCIYQCMCMHVYTCVYIFIFLFFLTFFLFFILLFILLFCLSLMGWVLKVCCENCENSTFFFGFCFLLL